MGSPLIIAVTVQVALKQVRHVELYKELLVEGYSDAHPSVCRAPLCPRVRFLSVLPSLPLTYHCRTNTETGRSEGAYEGRQPERLC